MGGAAAAVLAEVFGADRNTFTMVSGPPFAGISRSFTSFSGAAQENADSRVYAGIHFRSADVQGARIGQHVAEWVDDNFFRPVD